jgi:hypothetical protein
MKLHRKPIWFQVRYAPTLCSCLHPYVCLYSDPDSKYGIEELVSRGREWGGGEREVWL